MGGVGGLPVLCGTSRVMMGRGVLSTPCLAASCRRKV